MWETTFDDLCKFAHDSALDARSLRQRRSELELLFHHVPVPESRSLEVGCGGGWLAALLAREGKLAIGVDMAAPDDHTHSRGLEAPGRLARALGASNLQFLGCSGESLCFHDGSFDLVLSSYVLEHIPDRVRAVREMKRVAREDGLIVALVPGWMERVYAPVSYYFTMFRGAIRSAWRFLRQKLDRVHAPGDRRGRGKGPGAHSPRSGAAEGLGDKFRKFFRVYHPTFPFPRPHGFYRSSSEELRAHRYGRWAKLFEGEGLVIEKAFATRLAPTCILELVSEAADQRSQQALVGILKREGQSRWARTLAYSFCFVLRKEDHTGSGGGSSPPATARND